MNTLVQRNAYNITDILDSFFDPNNDKILLGIQVELSEVHTNQKVKFMIWKGTELFKILSNTADDALDLEELPIVELDKMVFNMPPYYLTQ